MSTPSHSKFKIILVYWFPLIIYCLAIYIQSSRPGPQHLPELRFLDKFLHFGAYGLLGVFFYRAYETLALKNFKKLLILISIGSATLYGISDEIHQYFVPSRQSDVMDVIANTIGSICGVCLFHYWKMRHRPR
jgi:VanZ family protein